jgi:hypothetical protein
MRVKVAANAHLGRLAEARAELSRVLAIGPKMTIAGYRAFCGTTADYRNRTPAAPPDRRG